LLTGEKRGRQDRGAGRNVFNTGQDIVPLPRGAVRKVPIEATRWRPTLHHAPFWISGRQSDPPTDCHKLSEPNYI